MFTPFSRLWEDLFTVPLSAQSMVFITPCPACHDLQANVYIHCLSWEKVSKCSVKLAETVLPKHPQRNIVSIYILKYIMTNTHMA